MGPQLDSCGRRGLECGLRRHAPVASMGPQLDSCGRSLPGLSFFASCSLQWGRNLTVAEGGRGISHPAMYPELQWGRNLTVAEGVHWAKEIDVTKVLQWGRNLTVAEGQVILTTADDKKHASMGPQLDSCGRL